MNTIFVSEHLCSGAWPKENLPHSLLTEGRSMLIAVCNELQATGKYNVITTKDERVSLNALSSAEIYPISSPEQEWNTFQELAFRSDATLVIAPELNHILEKRIQWLEQNGLNRCMSTYQAASLCSDKKAFYEFCLDKKLRTPETVTVTETLDPEHNLPFSFPMIIKPTHGAGATMTKLIEDKNDWWEFFRQSSSEDDFSPYIAQPFLNGELVSLACMIAPESGKRAWCPIGKQLFDGLTYEGGVIPHSVSSSKEIKEIAETVLDKLPGLKGFIGFDFVISTESKRPSLLEINPRITSSFLGYRTISKGSLATYMFGDGGNDRVSWSTKTVQFDPKGGIAFLHPK